MYVQTDDQQGFYIRLKGEIISSSLSGYAFIPRLESDTLSFFIGFPRNQWPEQEFLVLTAKKDRGFLLKQVEGEKWVLIDLQRGDSLKGAPRTEKKGNGSTQISRTEDAFAVALANAVGDQGIRDMVSPPDATKKDSAAYVVAQDSSRRAKGSISVSTSTVLMRDKPVVDGKPKLSADQSLAGVKMGKTDPSIRQVREVRSQASVEQIFVEKTEAGEDTIRVEIMTADTNDSAGFGIAVKGDNINRNCAAHASDSDVVVLRRQAMVLGTEEEMLKMVGEAVKQKCYTVDQMRRISFIFVTDSGRFQFFEQAYAWVADPENYAMLALLFAEDAYVSRFRQMLNR